jgi:hypothetical protein
MPRVRFARSGLNVAGATRARGDVVDLDAEVADYLCSSGQAVRVDDDHTEVAVTQDFTQTTAQRVSSREARRRPRERQ